MKQPFLFLLFFLCQAGLWLWVLPARADEATAARVTSVVFEGLHDTNEDWLRSFILVAPPETLTQNDLAAIRGKLMSAGVFSEVQTSLLPDPIDKSAYQLKISIKEQWTLIPVLRAGYGGGTPFAAFGAYDSHAFGRLWTLGLQAFRYGDSPYGAVVWAKAPQWLTGEYTLSFEAWADRRYRDLVDGDGELLSRWETAADRFRVVFLGPMRLFKIDLLSKFINYPYRFGSDISIWRAKAAKNLKRSDQAPIDNFTTGNRKGSVDFKYRSLLIFDDVQSFISENNGVRGIGGIGTLVEEGKAFCYITGEIFLYKLWKGWNLAWHGEGVESQTNRLEYQNFVGGLDAVRGFPDGYLVGPRMLYTNLELRYIDMKWAKVWLQGVAFTDAGWAGETWDRTLKDSVSSAGAGLRLVIPRINRFVLRFDYGQSLSDPNFRGVSLGFNQFFQAYKPLDDAP